MSMDKIHRLSIDTRESNTMLKAFEYKLYFNGFFYTKMEEVKKK